MAFVELENVGKTYHMGEVEIHALHDTTFQVEKGERGIVSVRISGQSGILDLDIYPTYRPKETEYTGRSLDSASFSVILEEQGEYKVRVAAKDYVGDYEIDWKTDPVEK